MVLGCRRAGGRQSQTPWPGGGRRAASATPAGSGRDSMRKPSSNSSTAAPRARKPRASAAMRSLSLTRSSEAPRTVNEWPGRHHRGQRGQGRDLVDHARALLPARPQSCEAHRTPRAGARLVRRTFPHRPMPRLSAPARLSTSMMPVRDGFRPTLSISMRRRACRRPARPRMSRRRCRRARERRGRKPLPARDDNRAIRQAVDMDTERCERPLRMVASRRRFLDGRRPLACRPASSTQLLTCALGTSGRWAMPWRPAPWIVSGGRPSAAAIRGAHLRQRFDHAAHRDGVRSDASPPITVWKGCAARMPGQQPHASCRSSRHREDRPAARSPRTPRPVDRPGRPRSDAMATPSARRQPSVAAQSAPGGVAADREIAVGERREHARSDARSICRRERVTPAAAPDRQGRSSGVAGARAHDWHYSIRILEPDRFSMLFEIACSYSPLSDVHHPAPPRRARRRRPA